MAGERQIVSIECVRPKTRLCNAADRRLEVSGGSTAAIYTAGEEVATLEMTTPMAQAHSNLQGKEVVVRRPAQLSRLDQWRLTCLGQKGSCRSGGPSPPCTEAGGHLKPGGPAQQAQQVVLRRHLCQLQLPQRREPAQPRQ